MNTCRFLPVIENYENLNFINLVYETQCNNDTTKKSIATFRMHFVVEGKGTLHLSSGSREVSVGDVFIVPPSCPFSIENTADIKYIYLSYIGSKANYLADRFKTERNVVVFSGLSELLPLWKSLFELQGELTNLRCEGVLLYTFSEIGKQYFRDEHTKKHATTAERIKTLIDDNFTDQSLNIKLISDSLSYHPKYISAVFKEEFNISITEYIKTLRVQRACTLMEQGVTSVKDIASLCGFSDPFYFSTVFKSEMGISPKEHIKEESAKA